jgi:uncharacterized protein (DUF1697 family)
VTLRYVALLRGINVGGHRVDMPRLRALFEALGLRDVSTFIASGNVVFSADSSDVGALRKGIEGHLERELGYEVATFLRTPSELAAIATAGQGDGSDGGSQAAHYVILLHEPAEALCAELSALGSGMDTFESSGREIHWRVAGRLSDSPLFGKVFDRATRGTPMTTRNMNTIRRLVAKTAG